LVRLGASGNLNQPGGDRGTQSRSHCGVGRTPSFVTVEKQHDFFEVILKEPLLMARKGTSHECDNARQTRLMDCEATEEAFNNHNAFAVKRGRCRLKRTNDLRNRSGKRYLGSVVPSDLPA
jgi:hypothetical protein